MALDRTSIVRTFPAARRGYDPAAVDAHLAAVADAAETLAEGERPSLSAQSAEQVRAIVEAAETSAARIRADAERAARERVAAAADAADRLAAAVDGLRVEAERLRAELAAARAAADLGGPQPAAPAPARSDDEAAARIVALELALGGTPRAEADRRLAADYALADRSALLDEVYAAGGSLTGVAVRLRRLGYRGAWWALRAWWLVARPHTVGVKVLARDGERVLFVRHTYGDRRRWELPGGGARRREAPVDAARREAREELGVDCDWRPVTVLEVKRLGKRTTLHVFEATVPQEAVELQAEELAEGRWAPLSAPPAPLGRDAVELLEALRRR